MSDSDWTDECGDTLVVAATSALGFESLAQFLASLSPSFPAPILLAPSDDGAKLGSAMGTLVRRSALPITVVGDRAKFERGRIYVVPPDRSARLIDGGVELEEGKERSLLADAAEVYSDRAIAVLLGGVDSQAVAGAVEVKRAGGLVIVQGYAGSSANASLPAGLPPSAVDQIVELERIGAVIEQCLLGPAVGDGRGEDEASLREILAEATRHGGIQFESYRPSTILRRIGRRMAVVRCADVSAYAAYVKEHPEELAQLVMAFLIKVTEFFRDPEAFAFLREEVLPQLIERGASRGRVLRLWSVGCATGEEPYSLALLLAEALGNELSAWDIRIFATDVDATAVEFARRGIYPANVLGNVPAELAARYLEPIDAGVRIAKALRQLVIFGQQDLSRGVPFPRIDLVVCRNLLIYFKPQLQQEVLDLFAYSLYPVDGFLFLGKAETARPSHARFELINKRWKVYRCTHGPAAAPARQVTMHGRGEATPSTAIKRWRDENPGNESEMSSLAPAELTQLRRFNESVLRYLPFGVVVIDRNYRILTLNGAARRLLGILELANDRDFLHTARGIPYAEVRSAIDAVFRDRTQMLLSEVEVTSPTSGEPRHLNLTVVPVQIDGGSLDLVAVNIADVSEQVISKRKVEAAQLKQDELVHELAAANRKLSELNKELQDTNEQLQAANEEMMLTQEELQATNEEFEATNEELQTANAELETNNEELQATNEELEATNDELTTRTHELQELTRMLGTERTRLAEIVELAPFYLMVLRGPDLAVDAYNPPFAHLFQDRSAFGRPIAELFVEPDQRAMVSAMRRAYETNVATRINCRVRLVDESGERAPGLLRCTVIPTHDRSGNADGVVVYGEDLSKDRAQEAETRRDKLRRVVESADQVALGLFDAQTTQLLHASPPYLELLAATLGLGREALLGRRWNDLFFCDPYGPAERLLGSTLAQGTPRRLPDIRHKKADGSEAIWDATITPIFEPDGLGGEAARYVAVSLLELTERPRARVHRVE